MEILTCILIGNINHNHTNTPTNYERVTSLIRIRDNPQTVAGQSSAFPVIL